jgi:hypothetical protein
MTRVLMAVPKLESTDDAVDDDTAELLLPRSATRRVPRIGPDPETDRAAPSTEDVPPPVARTPSPSEEPSA